MLGQDRPEMAHAEGAVALDGEAGSPPTVLLTELVEREDCDGHRSEERVGAAGRLLVGVLQKGEPGLGTELGRQGTGPPMRGLVSPPGEMPGTVGRRDGAQLVVDGVLRSRVEVDPRTGIAGSEPP